MLNRRELVRLAACGGAFAVMPSFAGVKIAAKGRVIGGGKPLSGVAVTDGLSVVKTDRKGCFSLPMRDGVRFVSVTVPSGWRAKKHYIPADPAVQSYDFGLEPWAPSAAGRELRFVHISDSEIYALKDCEKAMYAHVKSIADRVSSAFVIHTGDICYPNGMRAHARLMNNETMGRPMFYCLGNHDLTKEGDCGEWLFESLFGPSRYSFDACGVHFCVTPMRGGDAKPSYTPEDVAAWLKNDLAAVAQGMPVVIFNHSFWGGEIFSVKEIGKGKVVLAGFDAAAACNLTGLVFGHLHTNHFRRFGKLSVIQTACPQQGGVDLSPATVRVVKADSKGRLTSESYHAPKADWNVVTKPAEGGWTTRLPGPVYLGAPVASGGRVFVATLDDDGLGTGSVSAVSASSGKVLWSVRTPNSVKNQLAVARGKVFAQDADGAVRAYDCKTGREVWVHDPGTATLRPHQFGVAADEKTGLVFAEINRRLTAVDLETGALRWVCKDFRLFPSTASRPVCFDGVVTGEIQWHGLYVCDAAKGKLVWRRDRNGPAGVKEPMRWRAGTVAFADGRVYATGGKKFCVLDAKTGATLQEKDFDIKLSTTATPLVTENKVFLGSCDTGLVALDRRSLEISWKGQVGETLVVNGSYCKAPQRQVSCSPCMVGADKVAAACGDGFVRFWDASTGREISKVETGAPHFSAPLVLGKKLFVADFAGYLRAIPV